MAHGTLETAQTLFMQCYLSQMQSFEKSRTISENSCWIHHVFLVPINQLRYMFFWGEMMWNIRGYWKLLLNDGEVYNLSELPPHTSVYCARILYRLRFFFMSLGTGYRIPAKYGASMLYAYSTLGGVPMVERQRHSPSDWPWVFGTSEIDIARAPQHLQPETQQLVLNDPHTVGHEKTRLEVIFFFVYIYIYMS